MRHRSGFLILSLLMLASCAGLEQKGGGSGELMSVLSERSPALAGPRIEESGDSTVVAPGSRIESEIERGTGQRPFRAQTVGLPVVQNDAGDFSLNFQNVEVRELVDIVLGDLLAISYVIDDEVQGRITVDTPRPVDEAALLPTLDSSLRSIGAGLVASADGYEIVPIEVAARQLAPLGRGSFGIVPLPLRHVSAEVMAEVLTPFTQDLLNVSLDEGQNLLVLSGERTQLANLFTLVDALDVNTLASMSFGLFPLEVADARVVARELRSIFSDSGATRFLPIDRQNAVLVITRDDDYLATAKAWLRRLDRRGGKNEQGIYVYQVESGSAVELAATVSELFGLSAASGLEETAFEDDPIAPDLTRTSTIGPAPLPIAADAAEAQDDGDGAFAPREQGDDLSGGPTVDFFSEPTAGGGIKIVPHPATNTIVVMATEDDWNRVDTTLRRLDQVPLQVLIEATVVEVALTDELRYGVQFALESGNSLFSLSDGLDVLPNPILPGFNYVLQAGNSFRVILDALSRVTDLNVLSAPQLMVTSNENARLQVGDQVPVSVQTATPFDATDGVIINTVEFRDTGVILDVVPRVNPSGLISLDIQQEVSDVVQTTTSFIDSPTISQRRVASTVAVQSGETVILGGLTREVVRKTESGIPVLHKVPVIGPLFGATDNSALRTELLVMIRPRIIRNNDDARAIANELRERLGQIVLPETPAADGPTDLTAN